MNFKKGYLLTLTLLMVIFLSSCGKAGLPFIPKRILSSDTVVQNQEFPNFESTNDTFLPYIDKFEEYSMIYSPATEFIDAHNIIINFYDPIFEGGSEYQGKLALCVVSESFTYNQIYVNSKSWSNFSDIEKEALIFHELGHCKLGRPHDDKKNKCGFMLSLMNTYLISGNYYAHYKEEFLKELFTDNDQDLVSEINSSTLLSNGEQSCALHL